MNIIYYDCFAGISGDMNLAAMIDLGVEPDYLRSELDKLGLGDEFELVVSRDVRNGIYGTRVDVRLAAEPHDHDHAPAAHGHEHAHEAHDHDHHHDDHKHHHDHHGDHDHDHHHDHEHEREHEHGHDHGHEHAHHHGHDHGHDHAGGGHVHGPHRSFADIREIILSSSLAEAVKETSLRIFRKVAEAEAKVHGKSVDEVHFHEVGATDSIVDIVGAAICLHKLDVGGVWASPVELGGGFVRCAHGVMPVPAPATAAILHGVPTTRGGTDHEATTPTGAAILAALVDQFTAKPAMVVTQTAYGIGHRETELPNMLRVHLAEVRDMGRVRTARLLQCNVDDMTGEQLGDVMELFMEQGAMDVHFTSIIMKKNRPAIMISLLCGEEDEARFKTLLFRHTATLGVKSMLLEKTELERRMDTVETVYGPVTVKRALLDGKVIRSKPEYEECRAIARRENLPLAEVSALVNDADRE
ncbi:nickel pincer cofactor biosynthesis protein LarC [Pseudodesulfovibrio sp.]|uniref:nickel pincer cofactor biosynthesis protein LarC n=1 Tax=unclassified Pseudodesulfovibrio TaxID=2661612 RepID=UPI003B00389C